MRELIEAGELGDIYYYDSVRVNLGLFQHDVNVLWDLAVHDLSIMDYVLPQQPGGGVGDRARRTCPGEPENIAYLTMFFDGNADRPRPRQLAGAGQGAPHAARRQPPDGRVRRPRGEREDQGLRPRHLGQPEPGERLPDAGRLPHRRHVGAAARRDRGADASRRRTSSTASTQRRDGRSPTARPACASCGCSKRRRESMRAARPPRSALAGGRAS